jgi:hypothetical protein
VDETYRISNAREAYARSVVTPSVAEIEESARFLTQQGWKPDQQRRPGGQPKVQKRIPSVGEVPRNPPWVKGIRVQMGSLDNML